MCGNMLTALMAMMILSKSGREPLDKSEPTTRPSSSSAADLTPTALDAQVCGPAPLSDGPQFQSIMSPVQRLFAAQAATVSTVIDSVGRQPVHFSAQTI
jgi:hypothetical protein